MGSTTNLPVPAARQLGDNPYPRVLQVPHRHSDAQEQAEIMESGPTMQGAELMDHNLHIAEQNITIKDTHY